MSKIIFMSVLKKNIGLFVLLFISNFAYAQNCQDCKDAKTDSIYHDRSKCEADTTQTGSFMQYRRILPVSKEPTPAKVSPDLLKYPKMDPYKKKFTNLQIINTIGSHISKED